MTWLCITKAGKGPLDDTEVPVSRSSFAQWPLLVLQPKNPQRTKQHFLLQTTIKRDLSVLGCALKIILTCFDFVLSLIVEL